MRSDQNEILGQMIKKLTLMKSCRNKKTRVLMDWASGAEQRVSNNKMWVRIKCTSNNVSKYNNIDKYWTQIKNDWMKYNQHRLKSRNFFRR